ncbi:DUF1203 domain-containing protein [Caulobacter sp. 17J80-11]|uniref:DUF1203 domain-containing protein n=1 Tax=Caulobacter sp. 17J80-11 TaxID=2763502 RepID=UPI001653E378|nr:DUF1203 domain-containing protein [Caulobacter sp. 17J80-11]MBC6982880.1 DUF1203 domain-containing protein [Caulobacter sp. 17J80-11]
MTFRITGLPAADFAHLIGRPDAELAALGVSRVAVVAPNAAPCRITLDDAAPGETVLLLNYEHQPADTPYRSRHAIFVREGTGAAFDAVGVVPAALRRRPLSVRAFDAGHLMVDADLVDGAELERVLEPMLARPDTAYVHLHYAKRGCYAAKAVRA